MLSLHLLALCKCDFGIEALCACGVGMVFKNFQHFLCLCHWRELCEVSCPYCHRCECLSRTLLESQQLEI